MRLLDQQYSSKVDFHISDNSESSLVNKSLNSSQHFIKTIQVEMITMKEIYNLIDNQKIDLLKVDIEGMEWEVLENFTSKEYDKIDQVTVEFHDFLDTSLKYKTETAIEHLKSLGYVYVQGKYEIWSEYYDCLFCKPEIFEKYNILKDSILNYENHLSLNQRYINKEQELIKVKNQHKSEIADIKKSFSWKITKPMRKLASIVGF